MSWSEKYKKSIDCSNPKGFSQKAHCAGRKARQGGKKTQSKSVSEMKLREFKEVVRGIVRERMIQQEARNRGIKTIQKDLDKNAEDIKKALDFYKKNKNTDKAKAFIKVLKQLNDKKQELSAEFDRKVQGIDKKYMDDIYGIDTSVDLE